MDDSFYEAADMLLQKLGASITRVNVNLLAAWSYCEKPHYEGSAWQWNNPWNTTLACCNWTGNANSVGVKIYPSKEDGITATYKTIINGYYPTLVRALKASDKDLFFSASGEMQTWGTSPSCILSTYISLPDPPDWALNPQPPVPPKTPVFPGVPFLAAIPPLALIAISVVGLGAGAFLLAKGANININGMLKEVRKVWTSG